MLTEVSQIWSTPERLPTNLGHSSVLGYTLISLMLPRNGFLSSPSIYYLPLIAHLRGILTPEICCWWGNQGVLASRRGHHTRAPTLLQSSVQLLDEPHRIR